MPGGTENNDERTPLPVGGSSSGGKFLGNMLANIKSQPVLYTLVTGALVAALWGNIGKNNNDSSRLEAIDSTTRTTLAVVQGVSEVADSTNRTVARTEKKVGKVQETANDILSHVECINCNQTKSGTRSRAPAPATPRDTVPATPRDTTPPASVRRDTVYIQLPCPDTVQQPKPKPKNKKAWVKCEYYFRDGTTPETVIINGVIVKGVER